MMPPAPDCTVGAPTGHALGLARRAVRLMARLRGLAVVVVVVVARPHGGRRQRNGQYQTEGEEGGQAGGDHQCLRCQTVRQDTPETLDRT